MANWKKITRRSFLVLGAVVAGGAAFGAYKVAEVPENPLRPGPEGTPLNPWVIINADGVTVIAPRAEMGQGISTTLAALVAEELDVDWQQVRVMHGPPAQAYFNAGIAEAASDRPNYQVASEPKSHSALLAALPKIFSLQMTGGSSGTLDGFEKMRLAGAGAREALKAAAARRLGVDAQSLKTEGGNPRVAATGDHPDELDPCLFVRRELVPGSRGSRGKGEDLFRVVVDMMTLSHCPACPRAFAVRAIHFPKIPRSTARDRAVSRGSLLSDASRSSVSQPRSFSVVGEPKISVIAFAAVEPTAWSSARRIR